MRRLIITFPFLWLYFSSPYFLYTPNWCILLFCAKLIDFWVKVLLILNCCGVIGELGLVVSLVLCCWCL